MLVLFFLVWIIFNGAITAEITIFGIVIALSMFLFICKFMDYSIHKEIILYKKSIYFLWYVVTLIEEIVRANMAVIHLILSQREIVEPTMVAFTTSLKSKFTRVLLANSITLTPGTITVTLQGDRLVVHCLDKSLAEGMEDSIFVKRLERLERIGE